MAFALVLKCCFEWFLTAMALAYFFLRRFQKRSSLRKKQHLSDSGSTPSTPHTHQSANDSPSFAPSRSPHHLHALPDTIRLTALHPAGHVPTTDISTPAPPIPLDPAVSRLFTDTENPQDKFGFPDSVSGSPGNPIRILPGTRIKQTHSSHSIPDLSNSPLRELSASRTLGLSKYLFSPII